MSDIKSYLPDQDSSDGVTGSVIPSTTTQVGGSDGTNLRTIATDTSGNQKITGLGTAGTPSGGVVSIQGVTSGTLVPVLSYNPIDTIGSGTITSSSGASSIVAANTTGASSVTFNVLGTWVATIQIEATVDGTNWFSVTGDVDSTDTIETFFTINSFVTVGCGSYSQVRLRASLYTSGTVNVAWNAGLGVNLVEAFNTNPASLFTTTNIRDGSGNPITSDNNGNSNNQRLHIAVPDTTTSSTVLGSLNATVSIAMSGLSSVGFQILSGTLIGSIIAECSIDNGTTWTECNFYNPSTLSSNSTVIFSSSNGTTILSILPIGGSSHVRVRVNSYTSGTANSIMRASEVIGPVVNTTVTLPTTASKFSFGQVSTSTSATFLPIEFTTYTETTTNSAMTLVSANTNDSSAGTGARTVIVTYLDQTGAGPFTTTFSMNGTTVVTAGVSNMCFIEKIIVSAVGSTGSNVGILTLKTGGGVTVGTVAATNNQTLWAHHYIPTGKTCYISGFSFGNTASAAGNGGQFILKSATPTIVNTPEIQISDFLTLVGGSSTDTRAYISPIQVIGPARVRAYVSPYANAATTQFASFDFIDN